MQKDTSIKYLVDTYGEALTGFQSAETAAGLSGIQVAGINPSADQLQGLLTGEYSAWLSLVSYGIGWSQVDVAVRYSEGMSVAPEDGGTPVVLFTKNNIGPHPSENSSNVPASTPALYAKLWKVS